ncbi:hypothetical protein M440DRAFT_1442693 [Trichoderma longibrachiatum ATCC 18648]|uniref:HAD-like protein n=1 Tax=Trichoderma longibrachiatum ATCC 18648 TaxID=983965 RepID=A0A2T4BPZ3_TRILO|nr:hypothetical protein M440DRAFT_1442693 [Trichoderma longibrachiatum ATCC 18648]
MAAETDFGQFQVILLDIEGTVCPISFVKDVLFPYALQVLPTFLAEQWQCHEDPFPQRHEPVFISDWFDTVNAGPKTDVASYTTILSHYPDISPARWIFLSDNLSEVDAARQSGMHSVPAVRPGNAPLPATHPLTEFALSEFTPASVAQAAAAIATKVSA